MEQLNQIDALKQAITNNQMTLVYFGSKTCGVCTEIKPRIEELLNDYPILHGVQVDLETSAELCAAYHIFTIPALLVYIDGKEMIREARFINMTEIRERIDRYILLFSK